MPRLLLLYDGYCGFCTRVVQALLARDPRRRILALPSQTPGLRERHGLTRSQTDAAIWVVDAATGQALAEADGAANLLLTHLGEPWRWVPLLRRVPGMAALQRNLYFWVARNRGRLGRWYGVQPPCEQPGSRCVDGDTDHGL